MASSVLEERVDNLENRMTQLQQELQAVKRGGKDWRSTIGMFTDDEGMKAVFQAALKLRAADRKKARVKSAPKGRKPTR